MLNEKLKWGQGEDVEWSIRVRKITNFVINERSVVKLMKYKDRIFNEPTHTEISRLRSITNYKNPDDYKNLIKREHENISLNDTQLFNQGIPPIPFKPKKGNKMEE